MLYTSLLHVFVVSLSALVVAQQPDTTTTLVVTTTTTTTNDVKTEVPIQTTVAPQYKSEIPKPKISSLHYDTEIKHRYARTHVTSKISNPADYCQQVHFQVTLPENAFISKFVMTIKNVGYEAYVKEKEEAKADYDAAVQSGFSAAHISLIDRDSNKFGVSVNVEAEGKVLFNLTYEELLTRTLGHYAQIINVNPGQIVKDLAVKVKIQETSDITTLNVPAFKSTNEVTEGDGENKLAKIVRNPNNPKEAEITWSPDYEQQQEVAKDGLKGRLIIEYDVDRKQHPSQILIEDGHFVHFFAPSDLPPLRKQVVFVLDISGSMFGQKIDQLKDAMQKILSDLNPQDYFSIVLFSDAAYVWSKSKTPVMKKIFENGFYNIDNETAAILNDHRDEILEATPDNIKTAKEFVDLIKPTSSTNIMDGLRKGLKLVKEGKSAFNTSTEPSQPIMFFLTDGEPNVDLTDPVEIVNETSSLNEELQTPIYSLAFGQGADIQFLKKLSKANHGFARNIYEGSDATLQLNNFYKEISSPLLANVTFLYPSGDVDKASVTERAFPIYFEGGELIVLGKLTTRDVGVVSSEPPALNASYSIQSKPGTIDLKQLTDIDYCFSDMCVSRPHPHPHPMPPRPKPNPGVHGHLEKMWAYLTIKQLLEKDLLNPQSDQNSTEKKQALELALKYKFVTPLTSLVVVKPNDTVEAVQPEKSDGNHGVLSAVPLSVKYAIPHRIVGGHGVPSVGYAAPAAAYGGFPGGGAAMFPSGAGIAAFSTPYRPPPPMFASPVEPPTMTAGDRIDGLSQPESGAIDMSLDITTPFIDHQQTPVQDNTEVKSIPLHKLQWLNLTEGHLPSEEPIIELLTGEPSELHNYTVGINKTSSYFDECISPEGQGFCKHIEHCSLTAFELDKSLYSPYFCSISGQGSEASQIYAGVCCPSRFVFLPPPPPQLSTPKTVP